jgi:AbrB family looped-hinge helix DNA binding protein
MMRSTITDRGQTTIPAEVRKALNLRPRQRVTYELCDEGVLIRPETDSLMDLAGSLKRSTGRIGKAQARDTARASRLGRYR